MHTHDDPNVFAQPTTDVFDWLSGEGFVMVEFCWMPYTSKRAIREAKTDLSYLPKLPAGVPRVLDAMPAADPMASVADEVRALEGLLR